MQQISSAATPHLVRTLNANRLLQYAWDTEAFTATDAIQETGLTRSTVLSVCADLVERGWLHELDDARAAGQYSLGRPARRYAFRADAGAFVGVDSGQHRVTARITDLRGTELARMSREIRGALDTAPDRLLMTESTVDAALAAAAVTADAVLAIVLGVPAPTDADGASPEGADGFWPRMNPGFAEKFAHRGWRVIVENDANLAAIAEGAVGAGVGFSSFVSLLAGERFGMGIIADGMLVRGAHGAAGELHLLDYVQGVGSADGLARLARTWAGEARAAGLLAGTALETASEAEDVFAAAQAGDTEALVITARLALLLARVCVVIGGMLDAESIIIGGAVAPAAAALLDATALHLAEFSHGPAPALIASPLGGDAVGLGAIYRGLALVRSDPLAFALATS
ncbi:ROK family protein [Specibacter sp. NPDC057265]|uniref:ROK family protein n=1 Tax=Specibacter sp. NPDC057265 TaxID=3346075 RepID=UPI00363AF7DC